MERAKKDIYLRLNEPLHLYFLGDTHIGNSCTNERSLLEAISIIQSDPVKQKYILLMGDYCDLITHTGDKRFDPLEIMKDFSVADLRHLPQAQADRFLKFMEPVKDLVIGAIVGNHEESFIKHNTYDIYSYICDAFPNVKKLGKFAYYRLSLRSGSIHSNLDLVLRHGGGGYAGSTKGYPINKVIKIFMGQEGDIHIMGHIHRMTHGAVKYIHLNNTGSAIVEDYRYYGVVGTFLDSYVEGETNYAEDRGGEPITRGMLMSNIILQYRTINKKKTLVKRINLEEIVL